MVIWHNQFKNAKMNNVTALKYLVNLIDYNPHGNANDVKKLLS